MKRRERYTIIFLYLLSFFSSHHRQHDGPLDFFLVCVRVLKECSNGGMHDACMQTAWSWTASHSHSKSNNQFELRKKQESKSSLRRDDALIFRRRHDQERSEDHVTKHITLHSGIVSKIKSAAVVYIMQRQWKDRS